MKPEMRGRGWIEKRETKTAGVTFRASYRLADGKVVSSSFKDRDQANGWLADQLVQHNERRWVSPEDARRPYREWLSDWHETRNLRPASKARDDSLIANHLLPYFGDHQIGDISQMEIVRFVTMLRRDKGLAASTVREVYRLLAASYRSAAAAKIIAESPCVEIPLPKRPDDEMRYLTAPEVERLAAAIEPRFRCLVLICAYGGLRFGEVAALRPHRIDLIRGEVAVEETVAWVNGTAHLGPPKTKAGRRRVGLPASVMQELRRHLNDHASEQWLFPPTRGHHPLRPGAFRKGPWKRAVKEAGLTPPPRIHDLRHTAVSLWIAEGADVKHVSMRAGHTSVSFTLDRYGHLYPDRDEGLRVRLDDLRERTLAATSEPNVVPFSGPAPARAPASG